MTTAHPIYLPRARQICRDALERHRRGMSAAAGDDALNTDKNGYRLPRNPENARKCTGETQTPPLKKEET